MVNNAWHQVVFLGMQAMKWVTLFHRKEWRSRTFSRLTATTIQLAIQEASPALIIPKSATKPTTTNYKDLDRMRRRCSRKEEINDRLTSTVKRYGNMHGQFSKCSTCKRRWKWNTELEHWDIDDQDKPSDKVSRSGLHKPSHRSACSAAAPSSRRTGRSADFHAMDADSSGGTSSYSTISEDEAEDFRGEY
jgi:hypothetical protein